MQKQFKGGDSYMFNIFKKSKTQKRLDYLNRRVKVQAKEIEAIKAMIKAQAKNK